MGLGARLFVGRSDRRLTCTCRHAGQAHSWSDEPERHCRAATRLLRAYVEYTMTGSPTAITEGTWAGGQDLPGDPSGWSFRGGLTGTAPPSTRASPRIKPSSIGCATQVGRPARRHGQGQPEAGTDPEPRHRHLLVIASPSGLRDARAPGRLLDGGVRALVRRHPGRRTTRRSAHIRDVIEISQVVRLRTLQCPQASARRTVGFWDSRAVREASHQELWPWCCQYLLSARAGCR
jgi:hypothetical protein